MSELDTLNIFLPLTAAIATMLVWMSFYPENLNFLLTRIEKDKNDFKQHEDAKGFFVKIALPLARKISKINKDKIKSEKLRDLKILIKAAGTPYGITPIEAYNLRYVGVLFMFLAGAYVGMIVDIKPIAIVAAIMGFGIPHAWLKNLSKKRAEEADATIANVLDLISVCMASSMTLPSAIDVVCEHHEGLLIDELKILKNDIARGDSMKNAFYELTLRINSKKVRQVYNNVKLSEELGTPIANNLAFLADTIRNDMFETVKQRSAKAASLVLIPVALFILPAVLIIVMGPAMYGMITGQ